MQAEDVSPARSMPARPGTACDLFGRAFGIAKRNGFSGNNSGKSLLRNCSSCFGHEARNNMEQGTCCLSSTAVCCSFPLPLVSLARKAGAEFFGTFILVFAGAGTRIVNQKTDGTESLIGLAAATGLAVMIGIFATGHISGAHLNPARTIAFAALRHFPWKHVPAYVGAQVTASLCAAFALKVIFHPMMGGGVTVPCINHGQAFALEFIISFNLMFVVTAFATDTRTVKELAGIAVGATDMVNYLIAGEMTGASMNPVRTLGPAVAAGNYKAIWIYLTAPILGALFGTVMYGAVKSPEEDGNNHNKSNGN